MDTEEAIGKYSRVLHVLSELDLMQIIIYRSEDNHISKTRNLSLVMLLPVIHLKHRGCPICSHLSESSTLIVVEIIIPKVTV